MKNELDKIDTCEVCGNENLVSVLDLGSHPMCDDLIAVGDQRQCIEYPIEIGFCEKCLTAHQRYQIPKQDLFPSSYHYRSHFTADVLKGMENLVASCEANRGSLAGKNILDIGCNDGSLLDFFNQKGATSFGIEPTNACLEAKRKGHYTYNKFFTKDLARKFIAEHGKPDFITFTNVFAHIENLPELLGALKILRAPETLIVIENHYLGSVLEGNQFDTFYHEHPRTYSYTSFEHIAQTLGISVLGVEFPGRYGGNIRVFLGDFDNIQWKPNAYLNALKQRERLFKETFHALQGKIEVWRENKLRLIQSYVGQYGKLCAKAFPGRAAILIKLLGLNEEVISAVYEKPGSLKIGHYVPGTRIEIKSDEELLALDDLTLPLLNLAWHIPKEIREYLYKNGYVGPIVNILNSGDFRKEKTTTV